MTAWMNRFKIGHRIYGGFAVILLLIAILATVSHDSENHLSARHGDYARSSHISSEVQQIERYLIGLRRNVYAFLMSGSVPEQKRAEELIGLLKAGFEALDKDLQSDHQRQEVAALRQLLDGYVGDFHKSVELREQRDWLMATGFEGSADVVTAALAAVFKGTSAAGKFDLAAQTGQAQQAFWAARTYAVRFDADGLSADADQVKTLLAAFLQAAGAVRPAIDDPTLARRLDKALSEGQAADKVFTKLTEIIPAYQHLANVTLPDTAALFAQNAGVLTSEMRDLLTSLDDRIRDEIAATMRFTAILSGVLLLVSLLLASLIARSIARPVVGMTRTMSGLAAGDLTISVPALDNRDEIGDMARAVQVFKDNALENERLKAAQLAETEARQRQHEETEELVDMFGFSVSGVFQSLSHASATVAETARSMNTAAAETNGQVTVVSHAITQTTENAQSVASASEQLTAAIGEISRLVTGSSVVAEAGASQARQVIQQVGQLRDASERIGSIVSIIADIASQTNLLALNATIEAARAGEAGRGFAVVAGEVKNLSAQTQKATIEISNQINEIQSSISGTVNGVQSIGQTIEEIHHSTTEIAAAITQQQSATDEIARNVQFVSSSTSEIAQSISLVRTAADQTSGASKQVQQASDSMAGQADRLSTEVKDFLQAIKGAGNRHEFHRLDVNLPARITVAGKTQEARTRQISIGGTLIDARIDQPPGTLVELTLAELPGPIPARIAGVSERTTRLQFPMDTAHLQAMSEVMERLSRRRAA